MPVIDLLSHALAAVTAGAHTALTALGADPYGGPTWVLSVAAVVVVVRLALLPLVLHSVRLTRGGSALGCLPLLLQVPVWLALYHLLDHVATGTAVGAMTPALVASLGAATVLGVPLAGRGYLGLGPAHLAVALGTALLAAGLGYLTQRYVGTPTPLTWMPAVSAASLLVAGGFVPLAMLVYWACNATWTLGQTALLTRLAPPAG